MPMAHILSFFTQTPGKPGLRWAVMPMVGCGYWMCLLHQSHISAVVKAERTRPRQASPDNPRMMFRHLKTKLILAYGGLLGLILAVIVLASYVAIEAAARDKNGRTASDIVSAALRQPHSNVLDLCVPRPRRDHAEIKPRSSRD